MEAPYTEDYVRTSIKLKRVVDRNIEAYCSLSAKTKNQAMEELISDGLKGKGLQPDKEPKKIGY